MGLMAGVKIGGMTANGGAIIGYAGASVIKEQKEMKKFMDEYKRKEQDLQARQSIDGLAHKNHVHLTGPDLKQEEANICLQKPEGG